MRRQSFLELGLQLRVLRLRGLQLGLQILFLRRQLGGLGGAQPGLGGRRRRRGRRPRLPLEGRDSLVQIIEPIADDARVPVGIRLLEMLQLLPGVGQRGQRRLLIPGIRQILRLLDGGINDDVPFIGLLLRTRRRQEAHQHHSRHQKRFHIQRMPEDFYLATIT